MSEPCDPSGQPYQTYCSVHDCWRIVGEDCWLRRAEVAEAEVERLTAMRADVLRLHYRDVHPHEDRCQRDGDPWPCRDIQALRGESDG